MTDRLASPPLPTPFPLTGTHSLLDSPLIEHWYLKKRTSEPSSPSPQTPLLTHFWNQLLERFAHEPSSSPADASGVSWKSVLIVLTGA